MSTVEEQATSTQTASERPSRWRRRGSRRSSPAMSVSARGEPMVWLAGGALAICLVMIVGLLGLVVYQGVGTFWPLPVVKVKLHDGTVYMGEVSREQTYELNRRSLPGMKPEFADAARRVLGQADQATVERELIRTGNFDLTDTHFHWVSGIEFSPGSVTRPEWAIVIERLEWGRFYGFPQAFATRHERPVFGHDDRLITVRDFFQRHASRLDAADREALQPALDDVEQQLQQIREAAVRRFMNRFEAGEDSPQLQALLNSGELIAFDEVDPGQHNVTEIHTVWTEAAEAWNQYETHHHDVRQRYARIRELEKQDIGEVNRKLEAARLTVRERELNYGSATIPTNELKTLRASLDQLDAERDRYEAVVSALEQLQAADSRLAVAGRQIVNELVGELEKQKQSMQQRIDQTVSGRPASVRKAVDEFFEVGRWAAEARQDIMRQIETLRDKNARYELRMVTAQGQEKTLALGEVVRAYPANQLSGLGKLSVYGSRWMEFLCDDPREANSEGGVFPAIWGTIAMTLIMSLVVVPFGVLAALYLREYARQGMVVSAVRISINNLAGVPSIVFGVFGLGFFCYLVGAYVDGGPENAGFTPWPGSTWFLTMTGLAVVAVLAFMLSLVSLTGRHTGGAQWKSVAGYVSGLLWIVATVLILVLLIKTPHFDGLFQASLPNPTFGKGGLLWSSLTLALLTVPVVIVATEEALSAVPNSMREGSYACGASKWQTIKRIVLPRAMPGIMTGMILAMARGAGEVAPLMLVGAVKLAPELPVDSVSPFIHASRSFMHLGFHIYDLGFQSQNSEAAKPMVYTTTLLLILIIAALNLTAIWLRRRLGRKFHSTQF